MKKKISVITLILIIALASIACNKDTKNSGMEDDTNKVTNNSEEEVVETIDVGLVTDEGGVNDQSFNQAAWEGLLKAEEDFDNVNVRYQESHQTADFEPNYETAIDAGNDLIIGTGFKLGDIAEKMAKAYPEKKFAIIDYTYDNIPSNMVTVLFRDEVSSFLVGYIAAKTTETDKVGFVGGVEGTVISAFENGYKAGVAYGAKEDNKDIEVMINYAGNFTDSAKGKAIAQNMYQQGADIVFHAAGGVGDGVIMAAKDLDKWAIGVDRDQNDLAPDNVLTSAMKGVNQAVYDIVESIRNGDFKGGELIVYGLEMNGVDIAPTSDKNVDPAILDLIPGLKEKIIGGEISVPRTDDEYTDFLNNI